MKISEIDAFVVHIPFDGDKSAPGVGFWLSDEKAHPGRLENHPGDIYTEYPPLWRNRAKYAQHNETVIVKIMTDTGSVGWGECHTPIGGEITAQVIQTLLKEILYGRDPLDIHPLWETMYSTMRMRGHSAGYLLEAISGIDIALYDLVGKALKTPICKLLGAQMRDRIPAYASSLPRIPMTAGEEGIQKLIAAAEKIITAGHTALKIKLGIDLAWDCEILRRVRAAVGEPIKIAVDVNGAYDVAMARRAGMLMQSAAQIWWLEEPLMPENVRDSARVAEFLDVPVAGGESLCQRWAFNDVLSAQVWDIVQPDVARAGEISECKRISDLADTYGVPFAPHISTGTGIVLAAALQWAASAGNLLTCEYPLNQDSALNGILDTPFQFENGFILLPTAPGLGIEINETALRQWEAVS